VSGVDTHAGNGFTKKSASFMGPQMSGVIVYR